MTFNIKQYDTSPPFKYELQDGDGNAKNVSAATVRLVLKESDATTTIIDNTSNVEMVSDGTDGQVQYNWQDGDTDTAGYYEAEWKVTYVDGSEETFPNTDEIEVIIHEAIAE